MGVLTTCTNVGQRRSADYYLFINNTYKLYFPLLIQLNIKQKTNQEHRAKHSKENKAGLQNYNFRYEDRGM